MSETNTAVAEAPQAIPQQVADNLEKAIGHAPENPTIPTKPTFIKIEVVKLFEMLGYATATTWSLAKIGKNIRLLTDKAKDPLFLAYVEKLDAVTRKLYDDLYDAAVKGSDIEIPDGTEAKPKGKRAAKAAAAAKKTGGKKSRPGGPPSRNKGVERDAFGSAVGTRGFDAMKVITRDTPKKVADIVKESGHEADQFVGVFYNFLNGQVTKGNLKKSEKGYQLTAAGEKLKEKFEAAKNAPQDPAPAATPAAPATDAAPTA